MTFAPQEPRARRRIYWRLGGAVAALAIVAAFAPRDSLPVRPTPSPVPLVLAAHSQFVSSVAFSSRGRFLASGSADKTIQLFDTRAQLSSPAGPGAPTGAGPAGPGDLTQRLSGPPDTYWVAFNPAGRTLAAAGQWPFDPDQRVVLWDIASRSVVRILDPHADFIAGIAWSPDGKTLAAGITVGDTGSAVVLWNAPSGDELSRIDGYSEPAFSPGGKLLAAVDQEGRVDLFPVDARGALAAVQPVRTLAEKIDALRAIAFSSDGRLLATASDSPTVELWDSDTGRLVTKIEEASYVSAIAMDPRGGTLATASEDTVRLWALPTGSSGFGVYPAVTRLVAGVRDRLTGKRTAFTASGKSINCLAFSPDGRMLAAGSTDGAVTLWQLP